jgi:hypothetical protein
MSGPGIALQTAVYNKLTGDATLVALLASASSVYDSPPENVAMPYLTIGDDPAEDFGSATFRGRDAQIQVHTWAQGKGHKSAKEIMDRIWSLLHEGSLTLSGHTLVLMRFVSDRIMVDPDDGRTYHGVQIFRALLKEG